MPLLALSLTDDAASARADDVRRVRAVAADRRSRWASLVDRFDRRRLMIVANVVRVVLFGIVAAGAVAGWLEIPLLLGLLLVIGCCEVVFDSSAQAFLPMIVEPALLGRANGLLFAAEVVAGSIAGLSIGALLFEYPVGVPFAVNAASFALAALLIGDDPTSAVSPGRRRPGRRPAGVERLPRRPAMALERPPAAHAGDDVRRDQPRADVRAGRVRHVRRRRARAERTPSSGSCWRSRRWERRPAVWSDHRVMSALGLRAAVIVPYLVFGVGNLDHRPRPLGVGRRRHGIRARCRDHGLERRDRDRSPADDPGRSLRTRQRRLPLAGAAASAVGVGTRRSRRSPVVGADDLRRRRRDHGDRRRACSPARCSPDSPTRASTHVSRLRSFPRRRARRRRRRSRRSRR